MRDKPQIIGLDSIPDVIAERLRGRDDVTCYVGSNAATPTASLEALTRGVESGSPKLPFLKMIHGLLQGPVPYLREGLQDRVLAYSIFSAGEVRVAANEGRAFYLPISLVNVDSLIGSSRRYCPDVVFIKVCRFERTGEFNLGLTVEALNTAIDQADVVIAELDDSMPFTQGGSILDESSIDYLVVDDGIKPIYDFPRPDFDNIDPTERRIGEIITENYVEDGATLQVGIGKITDAVIGTIRDAGYRDLGVHTELYGDGLMELQKEGVVTNRLKKQNHGYSITSLIMGSKELYDFVHMRASVQMRACNYTNAAEIIRRNPPFISVNSAMGVDLFGNVWADFVDARRYYSGVGGQPDFVRALNDPVYGTPIIAVKSVTRKGESKIVKAHPAGVSLTASAYDGVVIVTEYGYADLRGLTVAEKALAIASIAHPDFRDDYLRLVYEDRWFTKPPGYSMDRTPRGVKLYEGSTKLP